MKFGFIGTNWITDRLIASGASIEDFEPYSVYSRTMDKAKAFRDKHALKYCTDDLEAFLNDPELEAVYIATPNYIHHEQAIKALQHNKHVLCEKPVTINSENLKAILNAEQDSDGLFMEAMKNLYAPSFEKVKSWLETIGPVRHINFHYHQYSSRYDKYKEGIIENAFKPELGNGAMMDIGVYTISPLIDLFGLPESMQVGHLKLSSGADAHGSILCQYDDKVANLNYSKIVDSHLPSEIIGERGIILIDKISAPNVVQLLNRQNEVVETFESPNPPMSYELDHFIKTVETNDKSASKVAFKHETSIKMMQMIDVLKDMQALRF